MKRILELDGQRHTVFALKRGDGSAAVHIDDRPLEAALRELGEGEVQVTVGGEARRVRLARKGGTVFVHAEGRTWRIEAQDALAAAQGAGQNSDVATAPMPGTVVSVAAETGKPVKQGEAMMTIESMKLETAIEAWRDGTVAEVHFAPGDTFDRGAALVTLEPEGE